MYQKMSNRFVRLSFSKVHLASTSETQRTCREPASTSRFATGHNVSVPLSKGTEKENYRHNED